MSQFHPEPLTCRHIWGLFCHLLFWLSPGTSPFSGANLGVFGVWLAVHPKCGSLATHQLLQVGALFMSLLEFKLRSTSIWRGAQSLNIELVGVCLIHENQICHKSYVEVWQREPVRMRVVTTCPNCAHLGQRDFPKTWLSPSLSSV